jgi:hypothetical protein
MRCFLTITSVASSSPSLLTVASYYETFQKRERLRATLREEFQNVNEIMSSHRLIADVARFHLDHVDTLGFDKHYVVVTTNYDRLLELALGDLPSCVLTVGRKSGQVKTRFSPSVQALLNMSDKRWSEFLATVDMQPAAQFYVEMPKPIVFVYKMHGCVLDTEGTHDSIVISDADYIENMRNNGATAQYVPSSMQKRLGQGTEFLFMGYSFSDWNVRSLYLWLLQHRLKGNAEQTPDQYDSAILRYLPPLAERQFFVKHNIRILHTDLDTFAEGIRRDRPGE